jgi:hypothetical protein
MAGILPQETELATSGNASECGFTYKQIKCHDAVVNSLALYLECHQFESWLEGWLS